MVQNSSLFDEMTTWIIIFIATSLLFYIAHIYIMLKKRYYNKWLYIDTNIHALKKATLGWFVFTLIFYLLPKYINLDLNSHEIFSWPYLSIIIFICIFVIFFITHSDVLMKNLDSNKWIQYHNKANDILKQYLFLTILWWFIFTLIFYYWSKIINIHKENAISIFTAFWWWYLVAIIWYIMEIWLKRLDMKNKEELKDNFKKWLDD
jgi:hypothetical protein